MTTIAASKKHGMMAADTRVTDGSLVYYTPKIFIIGDSIVGAAGEVENTNKWLEWMRSGKAAEFKKKMKGGFEGIELTREGKLYLYAGCIAPDEVLDEFYCAGSGSMAALVAMRLGLDPRGAVEQAIAVSPESGGDITVYTIADSFPVKKRSRKKKVSE